MPDGRATHWLAWRPALALAAVRLLRRRRPALLARGLRMALVALTVLVLGVLVVGTTGAGWLGPRSIGRACCMPPPSDRTTAFQSTVVYNMGPAEAGPRWNCRTAIPTLVAFDPIRAFAVRRGLSIESWLFNDRTVGPLDACQGRWRPVIGVLASDPRAVGGVPSIADSVAAFNQFVRLLERAQETRSKQVTHCLSILTWAVWKCCLSQLLPMSDDLLRAYLWDSLAFKASVSVLKHAVDAVKGWHWRLGMPVPMDGPGTYCSVIQCRGS